MHGKQNSKKSYTNGAVVATAVLSIICAVPIVTQNLLNESCWAK